MTLEKPAPRRRDADATRAAILEAAVTEFTRHGYAGAGVRQIAERAGVTAMLINRYFGSKESLFEEVVDISFAPPTVVADVPAEHLAQAIGSALAERTHSDADQLDPFLLTLRSAADPRAAEIVRQGIGAHVGARLSGLLRGPDAAARSEVALSLIAGVWLMRRIVGLPALAALDDAALATLLSTMLAPIIEPE